MPFREFPRIYGDYDRNTLLDEDGIRKLLQLSGDEPCADFYGHYKTCKWAVVEDKSGYIKDAVRQITTTVRGLREIGKPVHTAIIVADTFGKELGFYTKGGRYLWNKIGKDGQPIYGDPIRRDFVIEGWLTNHWISRW